MSIGFAVRAVAMETASPFSPDIFNDHPFLADGWRPALDALQEWMANGRGLFEINGSWVVLSHFDLKNPAEVAFLGPMLGVVGDRAAVADLQKRMRGIASLRKDQRRRIFAELNDAREKARPAVEAEMERVLESYFRNRGEVPEDIGDIRRELEEAKNLKRCLLFLHVYDSARISAYRRRLSALIRTLDDALQFQILSRAPQLSPAESNNAGVLVNLVNEHAFTWMRRSLRTLGNPNGEPPSPIIQPRYVVATVSVNSMDGLSTRKQLKYQRDVLRDYYGLWPLKAKRISKHRYRIFSVQVVDTEMESPRVAVRDVVVFLSMNSDSPRRDQVHAAWEALNPFGFQFAGLRKISGGPRGPAIYKIMGAMPSNQIKRAVQQKIPGILRINEVQTLAAADI